MPAAYTEFACHFDATNCFAIVGPRCDAEDTVRGDHVCTIEYAMPQGPASRWGAATIYGAGAAASRRSPRPWNSTVACLATDATAATLY